MKEGVNKYFLAVIPPEPLLREVTAIKQEFVDRYNSRASQRSPAHITLHMPFHWQEAKEERLFALLAQTTKFSPFRITLNGFGAFVPKTIFIQPEHSSELEAMNKALIHATKRQLKLLRAVHRKGYNPHMTVAYRDLRKPRFFEAWQEFKEREFKASFEVSSYWLLKHNGKFWVAYKEFRFTDST